MGQAGYITKNMQPQRVPQKILPATITPEMAQLIVPGDAYDPVALQFIPSAHEDIILPQEMYDPIGDYAHAPLKALVHRHKDRVLLKPTNICAVYCRFCFRRDMVGPNGYAVTQKDVDDALDYIEAHKEISEVILNGRRSFDAVAEKTGRGDAAFPGDAPYSLDPFPHTHSGGGTV